MQRFLITFLVGMLLGAGLTAYAYEWRAIDECLDAGGAWNDLRNFCVGDTQ